jgi:hypothetical protein
MMRGMGPFELPWYVIRRKVFRVFGGAFHVYGPDGQLVLYSEQRRFKLKEDVRLYSREDMAEELLRIQARSVVDISATYDVVDSRTGTRVGSLRRKGLKSMVADEWSLIDATDREVGTLKEDSVPLALLRRFVPLGSLVPQGYHVEVGTRPAAVFRQHFNPFVLRMTLDFSQDNAGLLDRRIGLAAAVLLCAVEGRQG